MRHGLLCDELDDITHSYDYGIVPGSATVFVKDELNNIGRLDLTLLEGVMIVVEVSEEGYKVASCSPLSNTGNAITTAQIVQKNLEIPFETMDNLLMAVSPMFRSRFQQALYDRLESVHGGGGHHTAAQQQQQQQQQQASLLSTPNNTIHSSSSTIASPPTILQSHSSPSSILLQQQPSSILLQNPRPHQHQQQQQELDLNHALSQDVLDDLHSWISLK